MNGQDQNNIKLMVQTFFLENDSYLAGYGRMRPLFSFSFFALILFCFILGWIRSYPLRLSGFAFFQHGRLIYWLFWCEWGLFWWGPITLLSCNLGNFRGIILNFCNERSAFSNPKLARSEMKGMKSVSPEQSLLQESLLPRSNKVGVSNFFTLWPWNQSFTSPPRQLQFLWLFSLFPFCLH